MKKQDFSKRIAVVVDNTIEPWKAMNTLAHVAARFGNFLGENFGSGESFTTKDGINLPRNSQYPIIIFQANDGKLQDFAEKVQGLEVGTVEPMYFFEEMIETTNDNEIVKSLKDKEANDLDYYGVGIFGPHEEVKSLTKGFELWS